MTEQQVDRTPKQAQHPSNRRAPAGATQTDALRVLVVGGAGHVGAILRPALEQHHHVSYMDIKPVADAENRTYVGSVTDERAVREVVSDVDAVVYLAMGIDSGYTDDLEFDPAKPDPVQRNFDVNIQGLYRVLRQALNIGVRRFVYASTLSVYNSATRPKPVDESNPPDAWRPYGMTKRLGEHVCELAAMNYPDATITGLRLVHPLTPEQNEKHQAWLAAGAAGPSPTLRPNARNRPQQLRRKGLRRENTLGRYGPLAPNDLGRLFLAALELQHPGAHLVQASGDRSGEVCPNDAARALLGWEPTGE